MSKTCAQPRPVDIRYTGLEAYVAILADGKQTSDLSYKIISTALALVAPQALSLRQIELVL